MLDREKENNTVCSSINSSSNFVNNVFANIHYLGFNIKLLFSFTWNFRSFLDFVVKGHRHCWGDFFTRWWEPEEEWFWQFGNFSKLKTAFCEYWSSIKFKISIICVSKEYEIKTKMVQEQWIQLKTTFLFFFIGFYWLLVGANKNLVGTGWMSKFVVRGGTPSFSQQRKSCINFASRLLYTMKKLRAHHIHHVPKWKIWALYVSQIYMVYTFTCLFSLCNRINLSHHEHVSSGPMMAVVSLKRVSLIKHNQTNLFMT